jgi:nicotinate-nucleotide adenylyltransferase
MSSVAPAKPGHKTLPPARCRKRKGNCIQPPGPVADGLRIGLLGGSFNPAHLGHIHASALALKALHLDYVWWLVSPQNPLKSEHGMAEFPKRLAAARRFTRPPRIVVTGIEAELGTRFTIETLAALKRRFPKVRFVWLMGSDNLIELPRWRRWQDIFNTVPIAVIARPGTALRARTSKAATRFKDRQFGPDSRLPFARAPAWAVLDLVRRDPSSASAIRAASRS